MNSRPLSRQSSQVSNNSSRTSASSPSLDLSEIKVSNVFTTPEPILKGLTTEAQKSIARLKSSGPIFYDIISMLFGSIPVPIMERYNVFSQFYAQVLPEIPKLSKGREKDVEARKMIDKLRTITREKDTTELTKKINELSTALDMSKRFDKGKNAITLSLKDLQEAELPQAKRQELANKLTEVMQAMHSVVIQQRRVDQAHGLDLAEKVKAIHSPNNSRPTWRDWTGAKQALTGKMSNLGKKIGEYYGKKKEILQSIQRLVLNSIQNAVQKTKMAKALADNTIIIEPTDEEKELVKDIDMRNASFVMGPGNYRNALDDEKNLDPADPINPANGTKTDLNLITMRKRLILDIQALKGIQDINDPDYLRIKTEYEAKLEEIGQIEQQDQDPVRDAALIDLKREAKDIHTRLVNTQGYKKLQLPKRLRELDDVNFLYSKLKRMTTQAAPSESENRIDELYQFARNLAENERELTIIGSKKISLENKYNIILGRISAIKARGTTNPQERAQRNVDLAAEEKKESDTRTQLGKLTDLHKSLKNQRKHNTLQNNTLEKNNAIFINSSKEYEKQAEELQRQSKELKEAEKEQKSMQAEFDKSLDEADTFLAQITATDQDTERIKDEISDLIVSIRTRAAPTDPVDEKDYAALATMIQDQHMKQMQLRDMFDPTIKTRNELEAYTRIANAEGQDYEHANQKVSFGPILQTIRNTKYPNTTLPRPVLPSDSDAVFVTSWHIYDKMRLDSKDALQACRAILSDPVVQGVFPPEKQEQLNMLYITFGTKDVDTPPHERVQEFLNNISEVRAKMEQYTGTLIQLKGKYDQIRPGGITLKAVGEEKNKRKQEIIQTFADLAILSLDSAERTILSSLPLAFDMPKLQDVCLTQSYLLEILRERKNYVGSKPSHAISILKALTDAFLLQEAYVSCLMDTIRPNSKPTNGYIKKAWEWFSAKFKRSPFDPTDGDMLLIRGTMIEQYRILARNAILNYIICQEMEDWFRTTYKHAPLQEGNELALYKLGENTVAQERAYLAAELAAATSPSKKIAFKARLNAFNLAHPDLAPGANRTKSRLLTPFFQGQITKQNAIREHALAELTRITTPVNGKLPNVPKEEKQKVLEMVREFHRFDPAKNTATPNTERINKLVKNVHRGLLSNTLKNINAVTNTATRKNKLKKAINTYEANSKTTYGQPAQNELLDAAKAKLLSFNRTANAATTANAANVDRNISIPEGNKNLIKYIKLMKNGSIQFETRTGKKGKITFTGGRRKRAFRTTHRRTPRALRRTHRMMRNK